MKFLQGVIYIKNLNNTKKITIISIAMAINIVGGFIALGLRLPLYLDGLGTVLIGFVLGPKYGALAGLLSATINGMSFDIYSFYFSPAQILLGYFSGIIPKLKTGTLKEKILLNFIVAIPICLVSSFISAKLFGTVTSSGSSYFVQFLRAIGVNDIMSVFLIQFITDYFDKLFAILIVSKIVNSRGFKEIYS